MSVIINIIRTIKLWQTRVYAAATAILGRTNYDIEHCVKTYVCGVKKLVKDKPDPRVACFHQNNQNSAISNNSNNIKKFRVGIRSVSTTLVSE